MATIDEVRQLLFIVDWRRKQFEEQLRNLQERELIHIQSLDVWCSACKKRSALHRYTFIQGQYYVRPSGHTGGDYYSNNETECCHLACPECKERNYLYNHPDRDLIVPLIKRIPDRQKLFDTPIVTEEQK
jgi:hypothetical protein